MYCKDHLLMFGFHPSKQKRFPKALRGHRFRTESRRKARAATSPDLAPGKQVPAFRFQRSVGKYVSASISCKDLCAAQQVLIPLGVLTHACMTIHPKKVSKLPI
jgi:hypothetical protein